MDKLNLYRSWAPHDAAWSAWVAPVLFADGPVEAPADFVEAPPPDLGWLRDMAAGATLVFDLPGDAAVACGLAAARQLGMRPIPVFWSSAPESAAWPAMVPTRAMRIGLQRGAAELGKLQLPVTAAPAFLLDANRLAHGRDDVPANTFDNRSAVFASDLPSADLLRAHGIVRCIVVRDAAVPPGADLAFALSPWRRAGMETICRSTTGEPIAIDWPPTGFWAHLIHRLKLLRTLRTNRRGGYGRYIAESSGG